MPKRSTAAKKDSLFMQLRAQVRAVILEHGTAVAPGSNIPEDFDDLIGGLVKRAKPTLDRSGEALHARIPDPELALAVSDHEGTIMAAYSDAGYFVGVSAGLELAALIMQGQPRAQLVGRAR